jgi:hypothetical protein
MSTDGLAALQEFERSLTGSRRGREESKSGTDMIDAPQR